MCTKASKLSKRLQVMNMQPWLRVRSDYKSLIVKASSLFQTVRVGRQGRLHNPHQIELTWRGCWRRAKRAKTGCTRRCT
eukprot:2129342-Amphidinium_carterae.1